MTYQLGEPLPSEFWEQLEADPGEHPDSLSDDEVEEYQPKGRSKYRPEVIDMIVATIRAGAWDVVAAEAAGITKRTFFLWMRDPEKREFRERVIQARAQARLEKEMTVFATDPKWWLLHGPGRVSRPGRPGWGADRPTQTVEIKGKVAHAHVHAQIPATLDLRKLSDDEFRILDAIITKALPAPSEEAPPDDGSGEGEEKPA